MINLSTIVDNINFELPNGKIAKRVFMCLLFVIGFLLGKFSLETFIAYATDKFNLLFPGDKDELS